MGPCKANIAEHLDLPLSAAAKISLSWGGGGGGGVPALPTADLKRCSNPYKIAKMRPWSAGGGFRTAEACPDVVA